MDQESSYGTTRLERPHWMRRKNSMFDDQLSSNYEKKHMNKRKRVVKKGGSTSVTYKNISKKRRRYFSDLYTTLLDSSWSYCVLMFTASFYLSWLLFAIIYYVISLAHGDFDPDPPTNKTACILAVQDFSSCFLFSLETQHTIGYGTRQTTTECPTAMIFVSLQSVLGCLIQAFMVGLVFSKLSRPQLRQKTVIFSTQAVITLRNRKLCLIFRIGDLRDDNFILGTQISAKILRRNTTAEGEVSQEMTSLQVSPDSTSESCIFFVWPLEIVHVIDKESPLYDMSADDLGKEKFELIVIMEGTIETSSMTFQARSSYLPNEILWGHRFESMVLYRKDHNKFQVNFSAFNSTYEVETPTCSARDLELILNQKNTNDKKYSLMMLNNVNSHHMALMDVPSPFVEEHDSSSQPASIINNALAHSITSPLLPSEYRSNSVSGLRANKSMINQPNPPPAHKKLPSNSSHEGRNSSSEGRDRKTNSDSESEREDLEITIPDPAHTLADDLTINGNESGWKLGN